MNKYIGYGIGGVALAALSIPIATRFDYIINEKKIDTACEAFAESAGKFIDQNPDETLKNLKQRIGSVKIESTANYETLQKSIKPSSLTVTFDFSKRLESIDPDVSNLWGIWSAHICSGKHEVTYPIEKTTLALEN